MKKLKLTEYVPLEYEDMRAVWEWMTIASKCAIAIGGGAKPHGPFPELEFLVASPTGLKMTIGTAVKAKRAGMLPKGYPDWHLPVAREQPVGNHAFSPRPWTRHALFIEEKRRSLGRYSPDQIRWFDFLVAQGNAVAGCRGASEVINTLVAYLEGHFIQAASLEG